MQGIVDGLLEETSLSTLSDAADVLSRRYRGEVRDGRLHLDDDLAARAYIATRLPATYAAISACTAAVAASRPDFAPRTLLDVGAGPGSVLLAAAERWPGLEGALLLEASPAIRAWGERLSAQTQVAVTWQTADATAGFAETEPHDLVSAAYVLNELSEGARAKLVADLWALTTDTLLLVAAPMAPHLAEEAWAALGRGGLIADAAWPAVDPAMLVDDEVTIAIQVNGKLRDTLVLPKGSAREAVEEAALASANVVRALDGKAPRKVIVVPDRLVNLVA